MLGRGRESWYRLSYQIGVLAAQLDTPQWGSLLRSQIHRGADLEWTCEHPLSMGQKPSEGCPGPSHGGQGIFPTLRNCRCPFQMTYLLLFEVTNTS